jgi:hypothetical protein
VDAEQNEEPRVSPGLFCITSIQWDQAPVRLILHFTTELMLPIERPAF